MTTFPRDPDHRCQVFTTSQVFLVDVAADDLLRHADEMTKYQEHIMLRLPVTHGIYSMLHPGKGPDIEGEVAVWWDKVEAVMSAESS